MKVKNLFLEAIKSRIFSALWVVILLQVISLVILVATNIHSNHLQIPVRFNAFSTSQYFRDQWFYLFNFIIFGITILIANGLISLKILEVKGRHLALSFLWFTVAILLIATILIASILRIAGIQ
ncbi:hypothetical protein FWD20_03145 [Candidatus Saccharibacteria bacterium]|nr:hypothetical protein [Candidatus Saccharibacteria bacterium]